MKCQIVGISLLILLSGGPLHAQDATGDSAPTGSVEDRQTAIDELEPAVDTGAAGIEEFEPGVTPDDLAAGLDSSDNAPVVMDRLDLGTSEITGNQELPKVLYIVPWRKSDPGDLTGRPANSLLEDVLAPVDRGEFVREVDYYSDLFSESEPE